MKNSLINQKNDVFSESMEDLEANGQSLLSEPYFLTGFGRNFPQIVQMYKNHRRQFVNTVITEIRQPSFKT